MRILVMGGTSFVSKAFAMYAIEKGYTVDIFTRGQTEVDYTGVNLHHKGDRHSQKDLKQLGSIPYDFIVDVNAYTEEDVKLLVNALDTSNLKRYVLCSTVSVYKTPEVGATIAEDFPTGYDEAFGGDYGYNKFKAEQFLLSSDIDTTIFRPTYIYGEYNDVYRDAFLFDSIERGRITVLKDECQVQFIYVKDLAKTFESSFHVESAVNQAYNLAHSELIKWSEWTQAGIDAVGKTPEIEVHSWEEAMKAPKQLFPFASVDLKLSTDKLKADGLYVPQTNFATGIKKAYDWYCTIDRALVKKRRFELL